MRTFFIMIISLLVAINITLHYQINTIDKDVNTRILDIAKNSHFVGCARVTLNFTYCRELSVSYENQMRKDLGL